MGGEKLVVALLGGLSDVVSLPHIAVIALLIAWLLLFRRDNRLQGNTFLGFFSAYLISALLLRAGLFNSLTWTPAYFSFVSVFYSLVGLLFLLFGGLLFLSWYRSCRFISSGYSFPKAGSLGEKVFPAVFWVGILLGVFFAVGSFSSPANVYVIILANEMFLPGFLWATLGFLLVYESVFVIIVCVVFLMIQYCLRAGQIQKMEHYRSWILIVMASVYLALGAGFLVIFIQQLV